MGIKILESTGLSVDFEGKVNDFKDTDKMVVTGNLEAHA